MTNLVYRNWPKKGTGWFASCETKRTGKHGFSELLLLALAVKTVQSRLI